PSVTYTLSLHDALPICVRLRGVAGLEVVEENIRVIVGEAHARRNSFLVVGRVEIPVVGRLAQKRRVIGAGEEPAGRIGRQFGKADRKSTRLNSSHLVIS